MLFAYLNGTVFSEPCTAWGTSLFHWNEERASKESNQEEASKNQENLDSLTK